MMGHRRLRSGKTLLADSAIHAESLRQDLPIVARTLQELLGQRLVAVTAGVADAKAVGKWARGTRTPHPDAEQRLRHAFHVTRVLLTTESAETVRAWFVGLNPELGDRPPAEVLAEDPAGVLRAARAFVAHG